MQAPSEKDSTDNRHLGPDNGPLLQEEHQQGDQSEHDVDAEPSLYRFYVAGIGASAGGLEALQQFFRATSPQTNIAFVVVQHLSPDFKSFMDEILSKYTSIPICRVEDGMQLQPDAIYLIPPKKQMVVRNQSLYLTDRDPLSPSMVIDDFFCSLAEDARDRAIGIVLSGTGTDGTKGIIDIRRYGGITIAQEPESAKFDGMPRSAIDTGAIDCQLEPEKIANFLARFVRRELNNETTDDIKKMFVRHWGADTILSLLQREYGIDFLEYKPETVSRRISRRMQLAQLDSLDSYRDMLAANREELESLYKDLLIGVTRFFRDDAMVTALEGKILLGLVQSLPIEEELRIWIAGCATGEEAYSLAILLTEAFEFYGGEPRFRIFATDIHPSSLHRASQGIYDKESLSGVSPQRLQRFFQPRGKFFQISQSIRPQIVFSQHNLLRDAPFTQLDLISCRNLLIYLQPEAQRRTLASFHFGLKLGGILVLGQSESPGELVDEFNKLDSHAKIYSKRRNVRLMGDMRPKAAMGNTRRPQAVSRSVEAPPTSVYDNLLSQFMPPGLLANEHRELVHSFAGAGRFLRPPEGRFTRDVAEMVDDALRPAIVTVIRQAIRSGQQVAYSVLLDENRRQIQLTASPIPDRQSDSTFCLVIFEESGQRTNQTESVAYTPRVLELDASRFAELEADLRDTRESLQSTIEELETSNEELQATNQEMIASNEELQSANEELQSVNEEICIVNTEYQQKIAELNEVRNDLNNLIISADLGIVFLDRKRNIRRFTPRIRELFDLLDHDLGRPIDVFQHNLVDVPIASMVEQVIESSEPIEREVQDRQGKCFLMRVHPYCSVLSNRPEGSVIAFVDLTKVKAIQGDLARNELRFRSITEGFTSSTWNTAPDGGVCDNQPSWEKLTGQRSEDAFGYGWSKMIHPDHRDELVASWRRSTKATENFRNRTLIWTQDRDEFRFNDVRAIPIFDNDGNVKEWFGHTVDVHDQVVVENAVREKEAHFRCIFDTGAAGIARISLDHSFTELNDAFCRLLGFERDELTQMTWQDITHPEDIAPDMELVEQLIEGEIPYYGLENRYFRKNMTLIWVFLTVSLVRDSEGTPQYFVWIIQDISERKRLEEKLRETDRHKDEFLAILSHELRNPLTAIAQAAELIGDQRLGPADIALSREIVQDQSQHLSRLLDDLLDVARLSQGVLTLKRSPTEIKGICKEVLKSNRRVSEAREITVEVLHDDQPLYVDGDPVRLRQIQDNLVGNALKYTPRNGRISVEIVAEGAEVVFRVTDNGKGISRADLPRIFDPFFRNDQQREMQYVSQEPELEDQGLGVGLTLVRALVDLHGGRVDVESEGLGLGSTFEVRLPQIESPEQAPEEEFVESEQTPEARLVVVEDNLQALQMFELALRLEGHHVHLAGNGTDGLNLIKQVRPEIAFIDIGLPLMDGCEVARAVRALPTLNAVYLVAITGYGQPQDRVGMIAAGFDELLIKPIRPQDLATCIRRHMTRLGRSTEANSSS